MPPARRVLVAGCGFVGKAAARLLHQSGWEVLALTHSPESAAALSGEHFPVLAADIAELAALQEIAPPDVILDCVSSGGGGPDAYRRIYLGGVQTLHEAFPHARLIFTSSTSVYAQTGGEWVDETSPAEPTRETGRILRETEDFVLARGGSVARLAGLYGPGRSALLRKFLAGETILEGGGTRFLNHLHRDDAASALLHLIDAPPGIYNAADDTPLTQRAICAWLAARFHHPLPPSGPIDTRRKRGWSDKRVSNRKLHAVGWPCGYPSFPAAIEAGAVPLS